MKFISFYTGHYEWDAQQLKKSFDKRGITNYDIEYIDNTGSWSGNTQLKAPFILRKLKENDSVVWTDADSRIENIPVLFNTIKTETAFRFFDDPSFTLPEHSVLKNVSSYLQSGTMYFKNTPNVIKLLEEWIELNETDRTQWDQWTLQYCLSNSDVTVTELPESYVFIDGVSTGECIIRHTQASRRFKDKIS